MNNIKVYDGESILRIQGYIYAGQKYLLTRKESRDTFRQMGDRLDVGSYLRVLRNSYE